MWNNGQGQGYPNGIGGYNNLYQNQGQFQGYPETIGYSQPQIYPDMQCQGYSLKRTTKSDALNMLMNIFRTNNIIKLDEFEYGLNNARHICKGSDKIQVLPIQTYNLQTSEGVIGVQYVYCSCCGKLIINKSCLDML